MIFIKAIKKGVYYWWTKIAYASIASLSAFLNPLFILITAIYLEFIQGKNIERIINNPFLFFTVLSVCLISYPFFPFSFAAINYQKKAIEYEVIYIQKSPKEYLLSLKETFLPSLFFFLFYSVSSFLLSNSIGFYYHFIKIDILKIIMISVLSWLLVILHFSSYIVLPLYCYRKSELSKVEMIKKAIVYSIKYFLSFAGVIIIDLLIYFVLSSIYGISILFFMGMSFAYRIGLYNAIVDKIKNKKEDDITLDQTMDY